jgi:DNA ligase (NAD+)
MNRIEEVKQLVSKLNRYRDEYYNNNNTIITDREYDELYDKLVALEKETGYVLSNSPTQSVGYEVVGQLNKVKHSHPLLSLDKTTDLDEFIKYFGNKDFVLMAKLDGLTCSLTYENGKLVRAESRGNGEVGEDITHNARVFSNLPTEIAFKGKLVVDGECIITYDEFNKIKTREGTDYKNPRNLVSGSVRQLNSEICGKRNVRFIAWKLANGEDLGQCHTDCFNVLSSLGFEVVPWYINSFNTIEWIKDECNYKKIPIDGIVGMFDDISYCNSLGMTGHHPKHSLAFKFYQEDNETTLTDVEWSTSRTGLVNPVAVFEPVEIDGTTVTRATLSNVSIIKELELGIGDTITVVKANQIIPKITQNLTRSNTYQIPKVCPACGEPLIIKNDNGRETLYCTNKHCKAIIHDKISNFASREAMNIVGISDERLRLLMDMGYITDFKSLYHLKDYRDEIAELKGFGKSSIDNIINAIEDSKKCKLKNVIVAIGIPSIGKSVAKTIAKYCELVSSDNGLQTFIDFAIDDFDWSTLNDIGEVTKNNINSYVKNNYDEIKPLVDILEITRNIVIYLSLSHYKKFDGKTFCITGKLTEFKNRKELVYKIESNGGTVVSNVTSKTQYLITNDKNSGSAKNKAAQKYGTKIISELDFILGNL